MADGSGVGPLLVGVDCSTSRIKAGVYGLDGLCHGWGAEPVPTTWEGADRAVHDPDAMWSAVATAIRTALAGVEDRRRVAAVACASVGEAALLVDEAGQPLTPVLAWFDRRGAKACHAWRNTLGGEALYALAGQPPEPILTAYKLDWLRRNQADTYRRAAAWTVLADHVAFRLSGVLAAEPSLACRSGAFDLSRGDWAHDFLDERGLDPGLFLPLRASGTALGTVTPQAAAATGLPATAVVATGGYDQALGALVCSGFENATLAVSMGSTEAQVLPFVARRAGPGACDAGICQVLLDTGEAKYRFLLSGIYTAGSAIEWLRGMLGNELSHAEWIGQAEAVPPGSRGVGFLPRLLLGNPCDVQMRPAGVFWGLGLSSDRAALYRAVLEGLACEGRLCSEKLAAHAGRPDFARIRAVGGDTENRLRLAIKSAVTGMPIEVLQVRNAASLGAAVLAGMAAGVFSSVRAARAQFALPLTTVEADPHLAAFYQDYYRDIYSRADTVLAGLPRSSDH